MASLAASNNPHCSISPSPERLFEVAVEVETADDEVVVQAEEREESLN